MKLAGVHVYDTAGDGSSPGLAAVGLGNRDPPSAIENRSSLVHSVAMFATLKRSTNVTRIPTGTPHTLYASPMPYGPYDSFNRLIREYRKLHIKRVVALVTMDEMMRKARRNVLQEYEKRGLSYSHLPIADMTAPEVSNITDLVPMIIRGLSFENIVIHCNAGVGRTGVVAACVLKQLKGCSGDVALDILATSLITDMTDEQKRFVKKWEPNKR